MEDGRGASGASSAPDHNHTNHTTQPGATPHSLTVEAASAADSRALTSNHDSDSDSDSDESMMDMSDPEPETLPRQPARPYANGGPQSTGEKRKITDSSSRTEHALSKKPRLSLPSSPQNANADATASQPSTQQEKRAAILNLPTEVLQYTFLYLPPASLGRCRRMCRTFNAALTNTQAGSRDEAYLAREKSRGRDPKKSTKSHVRILTGNDVFANARKIWFPSVPRPLSRFTKQPEQEQLQLIGGKGCQFCDREVDYIEARNDVSAGPGANGLRIVWAFGIRTCGDCLSKNTKSDIEVLNNRSVAPLKPGLPHAFITHDLHYIPENVRAGHPAQPGFRMFRKYSNDDIASIRAEYTEVLEYGDAAAEEWRKGLLAKGKDAMADAARWEKWEAQLRPPKNPAQALREYDSSSFPKALAQAQSRSAAHTDAPVAAHPGNGHIPRQAAPSMSGATQPLPTDQVTMPMHYGAVQPSPMQDTGRALPALPVAEQSDNQGDERRVQATKRLHERRQEIERRCYELDPPIEPGVLEYMPAFQAAILIAQPLTDAAWEQLKPKLLDQRADAKYAREAQDAVDLEAYHKAQDQALLQASMQTSKAGNDFLRSAKELYGADYDQAQTPLRQHLAGYVIDHVAHVYGGTPALNQHSAPAFLANMIELVRTKYLQDKAAGKLPEAPPGKRNGVPMSDPFLSLDNMKWVYDNAIKGYLPQAVSRDQFLCAGCLEDTQTENWLAFEGLIQHFAAKHTSDFSQGNVTVHWQQSEWPDVAPFHPKPDEFVRTARRRTNGAPRHTPQGRHNGPFQTPAAGNQGSYTNGYNNGTHAYQPHRYGHNQHDAARYSNHPAYGTETPKGYALAAASDAARSDRLRKEVLHVWTAFEDISEKDLPVCVRLCTSMVQAANRFHAKFGVPPTLDQFTEALQDVELAPIKAANGLACKTCVDSQADKSAESYYVRIMKTKLFSLMPLINHYRIQHHEDSILWYREMVEYPEPQVIMKVARAPGMDDRKLALLAKTFPGAFPSQSPTMDEVRAAANSTSGYAATGGTGLASQLMKKQKGAGKKKKKGKAARSSTPVARDSSQERRDSNAQEHEYDPRNPMQSMEQHGDDDVDMSKFDSDVAREKKAAAATQATPNDSTVSLPPETMAFLRSLNMTTTQNTNASAQPTQHVQYVQQGQTNDYAMERPPSVGRDDSLPPPAPSARPLSSSASNGLSQVDLSALLGRLNPQQKQVTTPSAGAEGGTPSISYQTPTQYEHAAHPLYRSLSTPYAQYDRPGTQPSYAPYPQQQPQPVAYRQSVEPPTPGHDLQAALERNQRQHASNQYAGYANSPEHMHVSPPRQRPSAYPEAPYAQGYGQPAPVQYVQLQQPPAYGAPVYQQPPPPQATRTVYVDEYGREVPQVYEQGPGGYYQGR